MTQTAVEWLFNQMSNVAAGYVTELNQQEMLDKAKQMEEEQNDKAYQQGKDDAWELFYEMTEQ